MKIFDFTEKRYGIYDPAERCGFMARTSSMPSRKLCPEKLQFTEQGAVMPPCPKLSYEKNANDFDFGGFCFRIDVPGPGAYHLEVELSSMMSRISGILLILTSPAVSSDAHIT